MTSLTVVIVTANPGVSLTRCLASLAVQSFTDFEVLIISNGGTTSIGPNIYISGDLTERLRSITTMNRGYGAACNLGARSSRGNYLVFLNDDTELHPDCLEALHKSLAKHRNMIFQPLIFHEYAQRVLQGNACDIYGAAGLGFYGDCGNGNFYVSGASLAASKKVFDSLEGFDENLFLYHDDLDLSWRARLMGFGVACCESAICKHTGGVSSRNMPHAFKFYLTQRNRVRVMIRNYSTRRMPTRVAVACLMIITGGTFLTLTTRKVQYILYTGKALAWNLLNLRDTLVGRHRIQRKRVRRDEVIEASMSRFSMDLCVLRKRIIGTRTS